MIYNIFQSNLSVLCHRLSILRIRRHSLKIKTSFSLISVGNPRTIKPKPGKPSNKDSSYSPISLLSLEGVMHKLKKSLPRTYRY